MNQRRPGKTPLRVLMVAACPFPTRQGTQVLIHQLATALCQRGVDVTLLTYGFGASELTRFDHDAIYEIHRGPRVPGYNKLASGPSWGKPAADGLLVMSGLALINTRRREGRPFSLLHGHNYEGALIGKTLSKLSRLPLLYHAHNLMGDELETYYERPATKQLASWAGALLDHTVPQLADGCIAVSAHTGQRLEAYGANYLGEHYPALEYGKPATPDVRHSDVVYLGNLDAYQSPEVMFDALARLKDIKTTIVTADPETRWRPMLSQWGLMERVRVEPHHDFEAVKPWLEGAKIALLPRKVSSGFPVKLINYLSAGRPVVASRESAQGLGTSAGVVAVDGAQEMAAAIEALLAYDARRETLAANARAASRSYTWPRSASALEDIYRGLLRRSTQQQVINNTNGGRWSAHGREPLRCQTLNDRG